jgi:hypothetical protein
VGHEPATATTGTGVLFGRYLPGAIARIAALVVGNGFKLTARVAVELKKGKAAADPHKGLTAAIVTYGFPLKTHVKLLERF